MTQPSVAIDSLKPLGFERIEHVAKTSFQDSSMCIIVPSRTPFLHSTWVQMLNGISWPMNQRRALFFVSGAEVGRAYDELVTNILNEPTLKTWKYILTMEDDTLAPADGVRMLIESIEQGPYDAVGGLYFTKGMPGMPMCYGDPREFTEKGVLDFRPRDIASAVRSHSLVECNGIAMGFSLYRMSSLAAIPGPRFVSQQEGGCSTQDLFWCAKARRQGQRFATDCRVRCAHADWNSGLFY